MNDYNGEQKLLEAIQSTPIIDNHAHPLLKYTSLSKYSLLSITSEAQGDALQSSIHSLAHIRAVKQLSRVLECEETWGAVSQAIRQLQAGDFERWIRRCLNGIAVVLVDDGLDTPDAAEPYDYFDRFATGESKRIVRIETMVAKLIETSCVENSTANEAFTLIVKNFTTQILSCIKDKKVVGFKSVICYRTGLAISREEDLGKAISVFHEIHKQRRKEGSKDFKRLNHPYLSEYFVHILAKAIRDVPQAQRKPIQFHTGLGDNDITLTSASPAHMQEFIRAYPEVPIVLLHGGYPFTRDLGFLAATYSNVYADIGEVFPVLSRDGQEGVVRQILELCPHSKILWSTDGHWFPETFFLAVEQGREVLANVVGDYVRKGDLTSSQAIELVENVFFNNSNKLYNLGLDLKEAGKNVTSPTPHKRHVKEESMDSLSRFLGGEEEPKFLRIYWNDMTATHRMRVIPIRRIMSMLNSGELLSFDVAKAGLGLTQVDMPADGVSASGVYALHPDLKTLRPGPRKGHLYTMGIFKEKDGSDVVICPRTTLTKVLENARSQGLAFTLGFEVELVIMQRGEKQLWFDLLDTDGHAWSVGRAMEHKVVVEVIEEAIAALDEAGIHIEMVHPESARGQYEFVLPKAPALEAVDTLLYARDIISSHATAKGYRMTLHPKPFATQAGTAAHVHMSISSPGGSDPKTYEPFYAGILWHLRAISAFTYSSNVSYERVKDGVWAGGTYIAWGTQNRETPLRKVEDSHWELKCMDGLANPYLALSAILSAGVKGYMQSQQLAWGDCGLAAPSQLSDFERDKLGVLTRFPTSLGEALEALKEDKELVHLLGEELVDYYIAVKKAEVEYLKDMEHDERRRWIMERY